MSKYKAILFDMDGTLVPMDANAFASGYFQKLYQKIAHHGIGAEEFVKCVWAGTKKMISNDGSKTNEEVFWEDFKSITGFGKDDLNPECLEFYSNEFKEAIEFTGPNPRAVEAVHLAKEKADKVILATNPFFPMPGQITRMGFVGLVPSDFDMVTSYEESHYCKPNPKFFLEIMGKMDLQPEECLMIGNDEYEDAWCSAQLGIDCYLVTDGLLPSEKYHHPGLRGSFAEMIEYLKAL